MKNASFTLIVFFALAAVHAVAQQNNPSQPSQAQTAPCTTNAPSAPANQSSKPGSTYADKLRKRIDDAGTKLGGRIGVPVPTSGDVIGGVIPKPVPCPPAQPNTHLAPVIHLPVGVISTWLCNPIITSTDASHTTTFVTPDELTIAEPTQANAFEADGAKADAKAPVSCANLRRDPRNNRVFLAQ